MPFKDLGGVDMLLKRFKAAQANYEMFRSLHQETYDFVAPQRETFRFHAPGQSKNRHVYDSTAILGAQKYVSRIKGSSMPSWRQWAKFVSGSMVPENETVSVDKGLAEGTKLVFDNINHSNFDTEITPSLLDYSIGTGGLIVDEAPFTSDDIFVFKCVPLSELYIENMDSTWRKHKIEVGQILENWPDAELPSQLQKMLDKDPNTKVDILNGHLLNQKDRLYYNVVLHESSKSILFEQSFATKRLFAYRNTVTPDELYGRGPAMQALPDIRSLNKMVEFKLRGLAMAVTGVYTGVNDGIFNPNTVRFAPGSIIPVASNQTNNPSLAPLPLGGDPTSVELSIRELQEKIDRTFFANPLGEVTDPVRSATENMIRQQEMLKQAGASFGRLRSELIEPLLEACIDILKGRGLFPDLKVDGKQITIKHTSPLAQAEDLEDFQNIQTWAAANIELLGPEVFMGTAKVEDFPKTTGKLLGIPEALIRDDREREAIGQAAAQAAQQQLQGGAPVEQSV